LLETLREYGREGLREAGAERDLRRRHRDWVASLVAEADGLPGAHQARWLDRTEREQENLRAALEFCLREPGSAATGLLMAAQCWLHWIARGHLGEARRWLTGLLDVAPEPTPARARALATLAMVALSGADTRTADLAVEEGLQLLRHVGDTRTAAFCQLWGGVSAYMQHDFGRSDSSLHQAAEAFASAGDDSGLASTQIQLGALAGVRGDLAAAEAFLEQSRILARQLEDGWLLARSTLTQGSLLAHWERSARAGAILQESVRASHTLGDRWAIAVALELLALVSGAEGRAERAAQLLGATEALWETAPPAFTKEWVAGREKARADARATLGRRAFEVATSNGLAMNLDQAVRLALEEAEPPRSAVLPRHPATPLSTRELEVASLVAQGLSNKEIAARLIIAERTVDTHVNHILTRLGFHSRVQLAAWHAEHARSVSDT
jgi:non-specific serine/threonine protein kinase